jgi:alpha-L-fucosidase
MFERDLPGENKSGLSFQKASERLPLETCETMNDSWGFNIKDDNYKSVKELIHYLVNAAGRNANFLLNVGPPPNGKMQPEFSDTLQEMGKWLQKNGESIYGTRGNILPPQDWGVATGKNKTIYLHILKQPEQPFIINQFPGKVVSCKILNSNSALQFNQTKEGLKINLGNTIADDLDTIIKIETK